MPGPLQQPVLHGGLLDVIKKVPDWNDAWWLLRYQITALSETFKRML